MFDSFDYEAADRVRTIDTGNNKIILTRTDPYGFINIRFEKGLMPPELKGEYTTWNYAERDVEAYLARKGKTAI